MARFSTCAALPTAEGTRLHLEESQHSWLGSGGSCALPGNATGLSVALPCSNALTYQVRYIYIHLLFHSVATSLTSSHYTGTWEGKQAALLGYLV